MELFKLLGTIAINNSEANAELDNTTDKAEDSSKRIVDAFKKIGTAVVTAFATDKIIGFGTACINATANAQALESQFSQVFGDLSEEAAGSLETISGEAGIVENRMKASFTKIAAYAKTTGMDTEDSLLLAERAMIAVADSATFYDRSLEETTESLQSFLKGNYENDAALGLSCTETTRNAMANELYGQSFMDLSESQKQLTLLAMVEQANELSGAIGQASRESDTWTNQTGNLRQSWTDLQAVLGEPILGLVIEIVKKLAEGIKNLTDKFSNGKNPVQEVIDKFKDLKDWFSDVADYASQTLQPIIDDVGAAFTAVKEALQPLIDAFVDYVTNGEFVEDITNLVKDAIDLLAEAYEGLKGFVLAVVDGFKSMVDWCRQNEELLTVVAIAVGTLTTAIIAYNAAQAIKNAGGIAELAQLALLQVQLWGLSAAQAAQTLATNIATAATTAFGAVMSFVTSPITLVVAGIGALIAIIYLLVKNWDDVSAAASACWEWICGVFSGAATWFDEKVIQPISNFFKGMGEVASAIFTKVSNIFSGIKTAVSTIVSGIATWISDKFTAIKDTTNEIFGKVKEIAEEIWGGIQLFIEGACDAVKLVVDTVFGGILATIEKVKAAIDSITGTASSGLLGNYQKLEVRTTGATAGFLPQMAEGGILEKGQVGILEGNGAEAVVPLHNNSKWISRVAADMDSEIGSGKTTERLVELMQTLIEVLPEAVSSSVADGLSGVTVQMDRREMGRMVREYA